ncbi:type VI secretion system ImpA family N-terminal domain-containing protein [Serratia sp. JSRIV001]|uniref:VasL domain-containing protein n=1 Tax=unclassified Serratia (in: enterobacteria) TaxID=2647522 RepID=UPI001CC03AE9|nr:MULTISPECIES: VasL domain-containing protein [unclassified Serratia (in: enterobacteria)]UAN43934.1 type VI secretion system ImpA family N-terminal domain-containing protein [Serratia sp. JSRIV001]UAN53554.1 type VI secretion system ImpA family N-terminal domain-containing protein [Serratia sp. JSRIV002]UAN58175.1 type VI secretion system ImpA family N-terminal domain-containing protein [Serratia sp. JSRIV004]
MTFLSQRYLKTGGDPRALADYAALRDELSKLTHPARPDVGWHYAEKLCLSLFEHNGVELQTAAWYTLTRTQLAGVAGLNEGLSIIEALVSHQWGALWPQPVHARVEILSALTQRLHGVLRTLNWQYSDLSALYQSEQRLKHFSEVLQRLELRHMSQLDTLVQLLHIAAVRLENAQGNEQQFAPNITGGMLPPPQSTPAPQPSSNVQQPWVYIAQPEMSPKVRVVTTAQKKRREWKGFFAGVGVSMLCAVCVGWMVYSHYVTDVQAQVKSSLASLPQALPEAVQSQLRWGESDALNAAAPALLALTDKQLSQLAMLSPHWVQDYGMALIKQTHTLWPESPTAAALQQRWQQTLNANALPVEQLEDSYQALARLQALVTQLNGLDEKRGKYLTVSELKSALYAIQQPLLRTPPLESLLRELAQKPQRNVSASLKTQIDSRLTQLLNRYALINPAQTVSSSPAQ